MKIEKGIVYTTNRRNFVLPIDTKEHDGYVLCVFSSKHYDIPFIRPFPIKKIGYRADDGFKHSDMYSLYYKELSKIELADYLKECYNNKKGENTNER